MLLVPPAEGPFCGIGLLYPAEARASGRANDRSDKSSDYSLIIIRMEVYGRLSSWFMI